jgi:hypothetical protein
MRSTKNPSFDTGSGHNLAPDIFITGGAVRLELSRVEVDRPQPACHSQHILLSPGFPSILTNSLVILPSLLDILNALCYSDGEE